MIFGVVLDIFLNQWCMHVGNYVQIYGAIYPVVIIYLVIFIMDNNYSPSTKLMRGCFWFLSVIVRRALYWCIDPTSRQRTLDQTPYDFGPTLRPWDMDSALWIMRVIWFWISYNRAFEIGHTHTQTKHTAAAILCFYLFWGGLATTILFFY
jgi:hypothetical protein